MQIVILGMHRSGTSMITRLINMLGAYIGPENALLEHHVGGLVGSNAKGHYERHDVMEMNDAILARHHASWDNPITQAPLDGDSPDEQTRKRMRLCLYGMDIHRPWVMKDPRLCLTLPCWRAHMEMPIAIIATRNPQHIAQSLHKRNNMPMNRAMALWEYYMSQALNATLDIPRIFLDYNGMLINPMGALEGTLNALNEQGCSGLRMPSEREVMAFIDPMLNHSASEPGHIAFEHTGQHQLWEILQGRMPQVGRLDCAEKSLALLA